MVWGRTVSSSIRRVLAIDGMWNSMKYHTLLKNYLQLASLKLSEITEEKKVNVTISSGSESKSAYMTSCPRQTHSVIKQGVRMQHVAHLQEPCCWSFYLFCLTIDPEYNSGTYNDDVPSATYLLGVNLSF